MHAKFDILEIPESQRDGLIEKLNRGELWDSLKGEDPVSSAPSHDGTGSIDRYADGSAVLSKVETPLSPRTSTIIQLAPGGSVSHCSALPNLRGWIRRADCEVSVEFGVIMMGFEADYSVKKGAGRIDAVRNYNIRNLVGGWDSPKLGIDRRLSEGKTPASATLSCKAWVGPVKGVTPSVTWISKLKVLSSAWNEHN